MSALAAGTWVTVAGRRVAIFRTEGGLHAVSADCPHAGGPLQDGLVADGCVTCPLHGRRFDLRSGAWIGGEGDGQTVYEVVERDGAVLLNLAKT
jgi:nitrite reductase (NADH) small subunit